MCVCVCVFTFFYCIQSNEKKRKGSIQSTMSDDTISSLAFTRLMNQAIAPTLEMKLLQENDRHAMYVGMWSTWWINDTNAMAKVILVTVMKEPGTPAPRGPVPLESLTPWIVLQFQTINDENPVWGRIQDILSSEFRPSATPKQPSNKLVFDPSQATHQSRSLTEPDRLARLALEQTSTPDAQAAKPSVALNRKRVEYGLPSIPHVRVFIEMNTTKKPLQQQMEADAGLVRTGTVLGAINEWKTWIVIDKMQ